ncbi:TolB-like translocation protein; signal peptide [Dactylosporangium sucinum]|uniref:TolB-like translocation protein signal peptide n=2 Tax=Dactylosporangium sucinum TaxID=1424081 RepID=A0A917WN03_9ACTN|nr:TolB-like translocation protein; signal peptide [Dactylosporangium sucinum]
MRARVAVLAGAVVVLGAGAFAYVRSAADRPAADPAQFETVSLTPGPRLLTITDRHLAVVPADNPGGARTVSAVECVRAYAAAGTGICLRQSTPWAYRVVVLDADLHDRRSIDIPGLPNRARVSASGRMVSWTTFVGGDSYTSAGFSTRTGILDTTSGTYVSTLEDFAITREGRPYRAVDVNFWGVTFAADDTTFYATMSTAGHRYLVRGNWPARTVETLRDNVECPSLSPDGTRIAFKQAIGGDPLKGWRLSVLTLSTGTVVETAERESVDDQAAWLDNATLAYTLRRGDGQPDIWTAPADGTGESRLLVPGAESPSPL